MRTIAECPAQSAGRPFDQISFVASTLTLPRIEVTFFDGRVTVDAEELLRAVLAVVPPSIVRRVLEGPRPGGAP